MNAPPVKTKILFQKIKMSAPKKMMVKTLSEEFYKLKDEVTELATLKKKMTELEIALKESNSEKEIMKTRIETLARKVEINDLASKQDQLDKKHSCKNECRKCDDCFESKTELKQHISEKHKKLM